MAKIDSKEAQMKSKDGIALEFTSIIKQHSFFTLQRRQAASPTTSAINRAVFRFRLGVSLRQSILAFTSGNQSCWTSIISEAEVLKQQGVNFFDFMQLNMGNGELTSFWEDKWHDSFVLKDLFPRLYVLETNKKMSVGEKLYRPPVWDSSFLLHLCFFREVIVPKRMWAYVLHAVVKYVPIKVNVMAWKIKLDAIPTRINMSRRGIDLDSLSCPICECGIESVGHLFFQCQVVRQVVRKISFWWNVNYVDFNSYEEWLNWLTSLRLTAKYKELLEGVFYVLWWLIWSFRNKTIFEAKPPSKAAIFDNVVSSSFYWYFKWVQRLAIVVTTWVAGGDGGMVMVGGGSGFLDQMAVGVVWGGSSGCWMMMVFYKELEAEILGEGAQLMGLQFIQLDLRLGKTLSKSFRPVKLAELLWQFWASSSFGVLVAHDGS
ncbi:RNA-directed DNA polymerase, eukaryota [Tanacetum coccineum]